MSEQNQTSDKRNPTQLAAARDNMQMSNFGAGTAAFLPTSMQEACELGQIMAKADLALPDFLRNKPGTCVAIAMQAFRWGLDPFAVANKCYSVNNRVAYESQLIASVVNTKAPIKERPKVSYEGAGTTRKCIVSATFIDEDELREVESPPISTIKPKNSPLWVNDPDQQLFYYTIRLWARRYVPEILMGVYAPDEFEGEARGPGNARDITPKRPAREDFKEPEYILWDHIGVEVETCKTQSEFLDSLFRCLKELSDRNEAKEFKILWENNLPVVDSLSDGNKTSAHEFANDIWPPEDEPEPDPENVSHETESEPETDDAQEEAGEEQPAQKFILKSSMGDEKDHGSIDEWQGKAFEEIAKASSSQKSLEGFRQRHGSVFAELHQNFPEQVEAVGKSIDEALMALK